MSTLEIIIPDIGSFDDVDVIEVLVSVGDNIKTDDPLITLETEKASMDIPATASGVIKELKIKVGDKVKEGSLIGLLETKNVTEEKVQEKPNLKIPEEKITEKLVSEPTRPSQEPPTKIKPEYTPLPVGESNLVSSDKSSHASPSTRKFARNLGVNIDRKSVV
jgi:pyruvate dehydrogenase E2 component (dihydrolipoamide acetyltransferase)